MQVNIDKDNTNTIRLGIIAVYKLTKYKTSDLLYILHFTSNLNKSIKPGNK